jgi:hypothetical protein
MESSKVNKMNCGVSAKVRFPGMLVLAQLQVGITQVLGQEYVHIPTEKREKKKKKEII